jgi:hypothetical protein
MNWIFGLIAVAAIALVFWDVFIRGRRGPALVWSILALAVLGGTGIAKGAGASGIWPLIGLVVGGVLFVVADRGRESGSEPASRSSEA